MPSVFTQIINRKIPAHILAEDERYIAFLDVSPLAQGHTLVIPKAEVDYIFNMEDELLSGLMIFAKKVAKGIERSVECKRIGIAVIGLEVPHAHIHLIPLQSVEDINFSRTKLNVTVEDLAEMAKKIIKNLNQ
ncbi:MAG: HIT family protein [Chitinophagales bacterium]|jgi:histidine triad (HIT) family protein|nr:HIT family protein [Chitinophagales bacterium]